MLDLLDRLAPAGLLVDVGTVWRWPNAAGCSAPAGFSSPSCRRGSLVERTGRGCRQPGRGARLARSRWLLLGQTFGPFYLRMLRSTIGCFAVTLVEPWPGIMPREVAVLAAIFMYVPLGCAPSRVG